MSTSVGVDVGSVVQSRRRSHSSSNGKMMKVVRVLSVDRGLLGLDDDTLELVGVHECVNGMGVPVGGRGGGKELWKRVDFQWWLIVVAAFDVNYGCF